MRLLFAAVGAYGHLYPVMPVALAAQAAGHEVAVATHEAFHPTVKSVGLQAVSAGLTVEEALGQAIAALDGPPESEADVAVPAFTRILPEQVLADLEPGLRSGAWDLVVHEVGNPGAGIAARAAGVPSATMALGRIADGPLWDQIYAGLTRLAAAHGVPVREPRTLDQPYLDMCPPSFQAPGVTELIETHILMRPTAWNPPGDLPAVVADRDPARPLVYLTLGTTGLFAQPGVLRQMIDALSGIPADALVSSGPAVQADSLGALPDNVTVADWVPQADLMPHVDVAVHHAGSGTLFAALANGVPQLLLPQGADQFANAAWVAQAGAARQLLPDEITPSRIAEGIRALLGNEQAQTAALGLQQEIARMPSPEESIDRLTRWARSAGEK
jgi:UDP:flavonoid glycosyltransferase YjiC (YdhE family)